MCVCQVGVAHKYGEKWKPTTSAKLNITYSVLFKPKIAFALPAYGIHAEHAGP